MNNAALDPLGQSNLSNALFRANSNKECLFDYQGCIAQFGAAMADYGLCAGEILADGKLHRFADADDKSGKKSAWYVLHDTYGAFGSWKTGLKKNWSLKAGRALLPRERIALKERITQARARTQAELVQARNEAATAARGIWHKAHDASADNPYCARKRIKPYGLKEFHDKRTLIVPIRNANGELVNLQFIDANGAKRFKTGGEISGCSYQFGTELKEDGLLLIGEGFATCSSAFEAMHAPVVCAFNAGNLLAVAQVWRKRLPNAQIILLADDDHQTPGNPGITKANEAAQAIGGVLAVPVFNTNRPQGATDFNDLHALNGLEAVRACIKNTMTFNTTSLPKQAEIQPLPNLSEQTLPSLATLNDQTQETPQAETDNEIIARLAALKPLQYDRIRKAEAKRMGVQVTTLDKLVIAERSDTEDDAERMFSHIEPWPERVDGSVLFNELSETIRRFIVCDEATVHAAVLWIVMTWCIDSVDIAPIAAITAPEKRCGKSQLLFLIGRLTYRPLAASSISPASLFRCVELWKPTLLLDEADAFMRSNEELRGLLNCGHTRDSAYAIRTVGDNHTPKRFFVWGAKALAGIGRLAETLVDRSITLELRRKLPHEKADKLRHAEPKLFERLSSMLARWSDDNSDAVRNARPFIPEALHDRAADNWEPLLQIADVAGGAWPEIARRAALKLSGDATNAQSSGTELLSDIQDVFETHEAQRLFSADLLNALLSDEEKPWATWRGGKPMTLKQLSNRLSEYGIKSAQIRIGYESKKGFLRSQFEDAFNRYLLSCAEPPVLSETSKQPNGDAGFSVSDEVKHGVAENLDETRKPLLNKACFDVSDNKGKTHDKESFVSVNKEDEEEL